MVWQGSTYFVPQDRSFRGTLYFFGQVDSVPRGLAVSITRIKCFDVETKEIGPDKNVVVTVKCFW